MENRELKYLKEQISQRIKGYDIKRLYYRKVSFWAYLSVTILAAISTIILGIKIEELGEAPRIIALIITGLITVISSYNTFFDNKAMWLAFNAALNDLRSLSFEITLLEEKGESLSDDSIKVFINRYESIVDRLNKTWVAARAR